MDVVKALLDTGNCNIEADTGMLSPAANQQLPAFILMPVSVDNFIHSSASCNTPDTELHQRHAGQYFRGYDQYIRAIHMAAYEARPDLMRLLLTAGASVDAPDRKGRSPVQCTLASTFFDGQSLIGKPSKTTARQRLTLQVSISSCQHLKSPSLLQVFTAIILAAKP